MPTPLYKILGAVCWGNRKNVDLKSFSSKKMEEIHPQALVVDVKSSARKFIDRLFSFSLKLHPPHLLPESSKYDPFIVYVINMNGG